MLSRFEGGMRGLKAEGPEFSRPGGVRASLENPAPCEGMMPGWCAVLQRGSRGEKI